MSPAIIRLLGSGLLATVCAHGTLAQDLPPLTHDDLKFSVLNMDTRVSPSEDFYQYASGGWLDRVERPVDLPSWGVFEIMVERLLKQMATAAAKAGRAASTASKGSAEQLVGDFYNAYMDTEAIDAAGIDPIRDLLAKVAAITNFDDMTRLMAAQESIGGPVLFAAFAPGPDPTDSSRYGMYSTGQNYGVQKNFTDLLRNQPNDPRVPAYRAYVADVLHVAGYPQLEAARIADLTLKIEIALFAGQLTPEEGNDPRNRYTPKPYAEVQALNPDLDLGLYFETIGYPRPDQFYMFEPRALSSLAKLGAAHRLKTSKTIWRFAPSPHIPPI